MKYNNSKRIFANEIEWIRQLLFFHMFLFHHEVMLHLYLMSHFHMLIYQIDVFHMNNFLFLNFFPLHSQSHVLGLHSIFCPTWNTYSSIWIIKSITISPTFIKNNSKWIKKTSARVFQLFTDKYFVRSSELEANAKVIRQNFLLWDHLIVQQTFLLNLNIVLYYFSSLNFY